MHGEHHALPATGNSGTAEPVVQHRPTADQHPPHTPNEATLRAPPCPRTEQRLRSLEGTASLLMCEMEDIHRSVH